MARLADLVAALSAAGVVLELHDGKFFARPANGRPVSDTVKRLLVDHKDELVEWLTWRDEALEIVGYVFYHLADRYVAGHPTGGPEWERADAALTEAFWAGDLDALRATAERYERFALREFARHANTQGAERP